MSDNRKERVSQHALNELISILQKHTLDTHAALGLLFFTAHSLMMSSGAKTFEAAADNGEGMRFTRLFPDMPDCPSDNSTRRGVTGYTNCAGCDEKETGRKCALHRCSAFIPRNQQCR